MSKENFEVFSKFSYLITSLFETSNSFIYCFGDYQTFKEKLIQIIASFCLIKLKISILEL